MAFQEKCYHLMTKLNCMQTGTGSNFCIITNLVTTATETLRSFWGKKSWIMSKTRGPVEVEYWPQVVPLHLHNRASIMENWRSTEREQATLSGRQNRVKGSWGCRTLVFRIASFPVPLEWNVVISVYVSVEYSFIAFIFCQNESEHSVPTTRICPWNRFWNFGASRSMLVAPCPWNLKYCDGRKEYLDFMYSIKKKIWILCTLCLDSHRWQWGIKVEFKLTFISILFKPRGLWCIWVQLNKTLE